MSTNESVSARLAFMRLDDQARATLRTLAPLLETALPPALDNFYAQLRATPDVRRFFSDERHINAAKSAQFKHWLMIAAGEFGADYAASVRRIGETHARIGLEPRWYIGGYTLILDGLIHAILSESGRKKGVFAGKSAPTSSQAIAALSKAAMLDMDLAISVYLDAADIERRKLEEARQTAEQEQQFAVRELASGLQRLADGDLTSRLLQAFASDYEPLRNDYNNALTKLQSALAEVAASVSTIHAGSADINRAAESLAQRSEQQAASLEQTAAALDQVTATVKQSAESAAHAHDAVAAARADAEGSTRIVSETVAAMSSIDKSSAQVAQIIGVIDEIAFQTNLLALNAGVEAARAGDAGRGFAVVAQEVRALAQRSAEAAKEIKTLIGAATQEVSNGVALVTATGDALQKILARVVDINGVMTEISRSSREQATGLQEVNAAVNQMDQLTQQNVAMVADSTTASQSLAQQADGLADLMRTFNISDANASQPATHRSLRPSRIA